MGTSGPRQLLDRLRGRVGEGGVVEGVNVTCDTFYCSQGEPPPLMRGRGEQPPSPPHPPRPQPALGKPSTTAMRLCWPTYWPSTLAPRAWKWRASTCTRGGAVCALRALTTDARGPAQAGPGPPFEGQHPCHGGGDCGAWPTPRPVALRPHDSPARRSWRTATPGRSSIRRNSSAWSGRAASRCWRVLLPPSSPHRDFNPFPRRRSRPPPPPPLPSHSYRPSLPSAALVRGLAVNSCALAMQPLTWSWSRRKSST